MSNNSEYKEILTLIRDNSPNSLELDLDTVHSNYYTYLINQGYIHGAKVEEYMSGAMVYGASVFLTASGEVFLEQLLEEAKPIRMTAKNSYKEMQVFLERVENDDSELQIPNDRMREKDYFDLVQEAISTGLVKGLSIKYASNKPFFIRHEMRVTTRGFEIMENDFKQRNNETSGTVFNFNGGDFSGAQIGTNNIQNNNYGNTLNEIEKYLSTLSDSEKVEAVEIVEIVKSENKEESGALSKFTSFLENHPKLVELTGKLLVWGMTQIN
ncbi:hypothetical protein [Vagococcus intermedius]|uniref:Uncharacterized protein n=1 Tax=Vagococcus intermedius TaxID=2991418 RepID=A0AAF0CTA0_9ENTE|nr:hypothetical protein [Vagococcus intermedius]WEG72432.1 hypothetical protein OL234_05455 [Vagococcus intermedius]WEG74519.1 hypothetical protein OL235_05460 [Vagococcus intermedius]